MALNFPSNPTVDQIYAYNGRQWKWNGTVWQSVNPSTGPTGPVGPTGPTGGSGPTGPTGTMTLGTSAVSAGTYQLALTDVDKFIRFTVSCTISVPTDAQVAFPVGTTINLLQYGTGTIYVQGNSGVTVRCAAALLQSRTQYSALSVIKLAANEWVLVGDLVS